MTLREDGSVPLVGIERILGAIVHTLSHPDLHGALVIGETGMGKSAIARRLVPIIDGQHKRCFVIRATANLADVPYGSLGAYLSDASPQALRSSLSALRTLVAYLREASQGRDAVVIIDDAQYLDDDSSHILTQLVVSRTIKVVLFSNGIPPRSGELFSLYTDGFISRVDLAGLSDADAGRFCETVLGGPVTRGAEAYFARQSAGNPLMLRALLDHASATGELVLRDGVWCLTGRFHPPGPPLLDLAKTLLQGLSEQERTAYEAVSLSGGLTSARLARLVEDAVAQQLLRRGLLRSPGSPTGLLRVAHPMMTRVMRALVPAGRSAGLRRQVFDDDVTLPALQDGRIEYLNWALDANVPVPATVLLEAARAAAHVSRPESALRFAGAAKAEGGEAASAVEEARVRVTLGEYAVAVAMLDQVLAGPARPGILADAATLKGLACVRRGDDPDTLHRIAEACAARLEAAVQPGHDNRPTAAEETGSAPEDLTLLHLLGWVLEGQFATARTELQTLEHALSSAGVPPAAHVPVLVLALRGMIDGALGLSDTGHAELRAALEDVDRSQGRLEHLRAPIVAQYVSVLMGSGDFTTATDALDEYRRQPLVDLSYLSGALPVLQAVLEVRRGKFRAALRILIPALVSLRQADAEMLLPYALGVAAWCAHSLGEKDAADAFELEFTQVSSTGSRPMLLVARAYLAAANSGSSEGGHDLDALRDLAETAGAAPFPATEKDTLELLVSLGDTERAWRLAELADRFEGAEAQVLSQYAHALTAADPDALLLAADKAESIQKVPLAADASARAMRLYADKGDVRARRLALRSMRRRQSLLEGVLPHEEGDTRSSHELTSREREIAKLAAEGATNRAIARILVLSTRTVEGHLYRIYGKLGITTREELTAEFSGEQEQR
ncbi:LuxR C-terminal-related transcriptional regulator [Arthrobacter agilis]|uniref:LuxR C-terminal-related transcriptional regulator n=1 Tax=Arthrobacter agilis TaxID=37921 RepID=UPI0027856E73|nr:LuxR C-terminal-related transcriptional regulator [Arthrobacter agilis]MDQ0734038.1 DNA-binding CsgD family transcriptional regulator [Arthrobacter agilis]